MVCSVSVWAKKQFLMYREREIAKRTAEGIAMRIEVNQEVPKCYNGFDVHVKGGIILLKKSGREYRFEVDQWFSEPQ
ncbi:hypothetical protein [Thermotoga sp. KOL6]|uniref:hypothetical protein n=1 Tax=Thermotoga sp. KOL6 TaxID=126741 RepID=UPI001E522B46|nr:hypothetical protein [Thermotoga sp. KOL6]